MFGHLCIMFVHISTVSLQSDPLLGSLIFVFTIFCLSLTLYLDGEELEAELREEEGEVGL